MTSRKATKRKRSEPVGDCGDVSFAMAMALRNRDVLLCHGWPLGTGGNAEGLRYWHAWVEQDGLLVDMANGKQYVGPRAPYYEAGNIEADKVVKYTFSEADALFEEHQHSGPWVENPYIGTGVPVEEDLYPGLR